MLLPLRVLEDPPMTDQKEADCKLLLNASEAETGTVLLNGGFWQRGAVSQMEPVKWNHGTSKADPCNQ